MWRIFKLHQSINSNHREKQSCIWISCQIHDKSAVLLDFVDRLALHEIMSCGHIAKWNPVLISSYRGKYCKEGFNRGLRWLNIWTLQKGSFVDHFPDKRCTRFQPKPLAISLFWLSINKITLCCNWWLNLVGNSVKYNSSDP